MSNTTEEKIIETAIQLFNRDGYKRTSLRTIAEVAGTTIGNLTYHFPKKESLLIAIQNKISFEFTNVTNDLSNTGTDALSMLLKVFTQSAQIKQVHTFYFKDFDAIMNENPHLRATAQAFRTTLLDAYEHCFKKLIDFKIFRNDLTETNYHILILTLLNIDYAWELRCGPKNELNQAPLKTDEVCTNLIYPYLTDLGQATIKQIEFPVKNKHRNSMS
ncbi:TetR/AcrR family transcriptional regulator [Lactiplantibacillus paraxiangfangensis]|uniref:TetR/AcrR family transcriptional regulator n=1 Tax=Lactiplantibacillus paraxiangfangensis TaxID=3076224 RepID=UPI0030C780B0